MAIDQPLKRKRGRPAGSQSAKSEMDQKIGTPGGSQSAKSKMEQKMALVKQRMSLLDSSSESDKDDDLVPMDDELAIIVAHQPVTIHCGDTDDEGEVIPIKVVRPRGVEHEQRKLPSIPQTHNAQNISTGVTNTAKESDVKGQMISTRVHDDCGSAMARAKDVQAKLPAKHPSFIKCMLQSHVVRGFWLGLPTYFCNKHLPKQDTGIMLEDENGQEHHTTYLGAKQGLSAGWRGFAIKHDIKVGNVVVFQLVRPTKFKVYIVRDKFITTDGALGLLNFKVCKEGKLSNKESSDELKSKKNLKVTTVDGKVPQSDIDSIVTEAIDGIRISDSDTDFGDVTSFSNFNIVVDSLIIDCKFHDHLRRTYYELCHSQKSFLHKHLLKQLNLTLVVGVIMETISIAEGIRACKAQASSQEDLLIWKKTLESFELLGMNVAFLLKRVNDLLGLSTQSRDLSECQKYKDLKLERSRAGEKLNTLELMLSNVKDVLQKMDAEMEEMESSVKKNGQTLEQLATAPW